HGLAASSLASQRRQMRLGQVGAVMAAGFEIRRRVTDPFRRRAHRDSTPAPSGAPGFPANPRRVAVSSKSYAPMQDLLLHTFPAWPVMQPRPPSPAMHRVHPPVAFVFFSFSSRIPE